MENNTTMLRKAKETKLKLIQEANQILLNENLVRKVSVEDLKDGEQGTVKVNYKENGRTIISFKGKYIEFMNGEYVKGKG